MACLCLVRHKMSHHLVDLKLQRVRRTWVQQSCHSFSLAGRSTCTTFSFRSSICELRRSSLLRVSRWPPPSRLSRVSNSTGWKSWLAPGSKRRWSSRTMISTRTSPTLVGMSSALRMRQKTSPLSFMAFLRGTARLSSPNAPVMRFRMSSSST